MSAAPSPLGPLAEDLAAAALALARRFAAGATLWCVAPAWPEHAHHVAVEFVHPVVMGARALPAVAVTEADALGALRPLVATGDVLLAVAPAGDETVAAVMRRAAAWGASTLWLGTGPRPAPGAADHVLWQEDSTQAPVLLYHLLWELTQVCFEHPGLLAEADGCEGPGCAVCADEGRLAEVLEPPAAGGTGAATVRTATGPERVDVTLVGRVATGDLLLVHAGTAVSLVEPASAGRAP